MRAQDKRRSDAFLIRVWRELESDRRWRASVTHLATGELRHFTTYEDLLGFLDRWVEPGMF